MNRKRVFTSMAILGSIYTIWLFTSTEKLRFRGYSSQEFTDKISGSERSKIAEFVDVMASRQDERKRQLVAYCKNRKQKVLHAKDLNHFIVDNKHRVVYCYIPKVACTTWKKIMAQLVGLESTSVHEQRFNLLSSHSRAEVSFILGNYYTFLFVREPLERLLSAYRNKFTRQTRVYKKYAKKLKRSAMVRQGANATAFAEGGDITFQEFISYLINVHAKGGRLNEHWNHYDNLCHPCEINFNFIGHYETLREDAPFVLHEAGVDQLVSFPSVRYTATKDILESYYSEVPQKDILRLQKLYQRDFQMFGY